MTLFDDFQKQLLSDAVVDHGFESGGEDYKVALITNAVRATKDDVDPELGDYTECSGGTYAAQAIANQDIDDNDDYYYAVADAVTFDKDAASGPTDCYQAILYVDDNPYPCVAFIELTLDAGTTPLSLQDAAIVLSFGSGTRRIFKMSIPENA